MFTLMLPWLTSLYKKPDFLMPQQVLSKAFRSHFGQQLKQRQWSCDPSVWQKNWGVHIQPFGNGINAVKYLGAYVARSVIGDSRILEISRTSVTFRYKDRAKGGVQAIKTLDGVEFTRRYAWVELIHQKTRDRVDPMLGADLAGRWAGNLAAAIAALGLDRGHMRKLQDAYKELIPW
jgi:hypothetical protein